MMESGKQLILFVAICLYFSRNSSSGISLNSVPENNDTINLSPSGRNCKAHTTDGRVCSIPFVYKGVNYTKCTDVDSAPGKLWCSLTPDYDADEKWTSCAGVNCDDCRDCSVRTLSGKTCQFPFHYCGAERHYCIMGQDQKPWCSLNGYTTYRGVDWDYCTPSQCSEKAELESPAVHIDIDGDCKGFTITGQKCSFPFTYKGMMYINATDVDNQGEKWCSLTPNFDSDHQWQSYAGSLCKDCSVLTTAGAPCHFPFEYKGRTFNYCTTVDEESLWCSTDAVFNGSWGFCKTDRTVCGASFKVCQTEQISSEDYRVEYISVKSVNSNKMKEISEELTIDSVEECKKACDNFAGCHSFTFNEAEAKCVTSVGTEVYDADGWDLYWLPEPRPLRENDLKIAESKVNIYEQFGGARAISGRLEIYHGGKWNTICNRGWDKEDHRKACEQLDYVFAYDMTDPFFTGPVKPGKGEIAMSDVNCTGVPSGQFLHDCSFAGWYNVVQSIYCKYETYPPQIAKKTKPIFFSPFGST